MPEKEKSGRSEASWLGFLLPPLVVIAAGFLWIAASRHDSDNAPGAPSRGLKAGTAYYVYVSQAELYPTNQENEPWDSGSAASPDIRNRIVWQGNTIYESPTADDTLIAEWSGVKDGALDKLLGEKLIRAGQVRAVKDGHITIHVEDVDTLRNDPAGTIKLPIMDLAEGVNDLTYEKKEGRAIKRLRIKLVSSDQPLEAIIGKLR